MDYRELLSESLTALSSDKARTALAMLGVVVGIGSVIALISLGQASQLSVEQRIESLGSNLLTISPGSQSRGGVRGAAGGMTTLTLGDAEAIATSSRITTVETVSPEYSSRNVQIVAGRNNANTSVMGVTPEYTEVHNITTTIGQFIGQQNVAGLNKVAVLGPQTAEDLFGKGSNPVGQFVRINGMSFRVVGVTESKGGAGFMNQDDRIYIPLTTSQTLLFGADHLTSIAVAALNEDVMTEARDQIGYLLLERHRISDPASADFSISSQEDILSTMTEVTGTFTTLLSGIAAISLLVGGIGIMNIMLVTVTERTREIGLRKALGAKRNIITTQFLLEAVLVTFVGGLVGVLLGVGVSCFLSNLMELPFAFSWSSIFLSFGVSVGVGILFGWYPARKAAALEPIEALRYE